MTKWMIEPTALEGRAMSDERKCECCGDSVAKGYKYRCLCCAYRLTCRGCRRCFYHCNYTECSTCEGSGKVASVTKGTQDETDSP